MKILRNIAALAFITVMLASCGGSGEGKSIGGSADTNQNNSTQGATSVGGMDSTAKTGTANDSTSMSEGNAKPDGRPQK
jgi:hypothetical protein